MGEVNSVRGRLLTAGLITSATVALVVMALVRGNSQAADAAQAAGSSSLPAPTVTAPSPSHGAVNPSLQAPPANSSEVYVYPSGSGAVLVYPDGSQVYVPNVGRSTNRREGREFEHGF